MCLPQAKCSLVTFCLILYALLTGQAQFRTYEVPSTSVYLLYTLHLSQYTENSVNAGLFEDELETLI